MTGFTVDKFRIVVEVRSNTTGEKLMHAFRQVDDIIDHLSNVGCPFVPVLVYIDMELPEKYAFHLELLKKRHLMLFMTRELSEVTKFCRM